MVKRKLNYPNGMIVDLSNIRISNNKYEWDKSVGAKIPFIYNGVEDYFILEDYKKSKIIISYKGLIKTISCSHFLREERCGSVLNPGTVIGKNTNIYPLSSVRGVVPANSIYKNKDEIVEKI